VKKSGPPKRDPAKLREWEQRSRTSLARNPDKQLERHAPLRPISERQRAKKKLQRETEGPLTPREWRIEVAKRAGLRCMVTSPPVEAKHPLDPRFHAHHPLEKGELRARGLYAHVWDPRNGCFVLALVHMAHRGVNSVPIPRSALPDSVWEFCAEMDALEGTGWATSKVEAAHPA
jgi:hypothetical protein